VIEVFPVLSQLAVELPAFLAYRFAALVSNNEDLNSLNSRVRYTLSRSRGRAACRAVAGSGLTRWRYVEYRTANAKTYALQEGTPQRASGLSLIRLQRGILRDHGFSTSTRGLWRRCARSSDGAIWARWPPSQPVRRPGILVGIVISSMASTVLK